MTFYIYIDILQVMFSTFSVNGKGEVMKEKYEAPEIVVMESDIKDVIAVSATHEGFEEEEYEW